MNNNTTIPTCEMICANNVVDSGKFHNVQINVLNHLKDCLIKTYGPMGSSTAIMKGTDQSSSYVIYSKDGRKVLKNILYSKPIEASIKSEIDEIVSYVDDKVGDATTSAICLSALILAGLRKVLDDSKLPPRKVINEFNNLIEEIKSKIMEQANPISLAAIYNIAMISTNGNEKISKMIRDIYEEFGFDVSLSVDISNDSDTKLKIYDGLSIDEGMSDHCYINNIAKGISEIRNAKIYTFMDPIDNVEDFQFFEKIIYDNIFNHYEDGNYVPTVIVAPKISRDATVLNLLAEYLHEFDQMPDKKPPICIISNVSGITQELSIDICTLSGGKIIKRYIDPEVQKKDQEAGLAPTLETIHEFAGWCELVSASLTYTKFINPYDLVMNDKKQYNSLINFLKSELKNLKDNNEDDLVIGRIKKRLKFLESNLVEILVGGITVSDRDNTKDLVEDAIKNCMSAAEFGWGRGANYEAFSIIKKLYRDEPKEKEIIVQTDTKYRTEMILNIRKRLLDILDYAYSEITRTLYSSITSDNNILNTIVAFSISYAQPINIVELMEFTSCITSKSIVDFMETRSKNNVICSIRTDIEVLEAISKIMSIMASSNQCLLQSTALNQY